MSKKLRINTRVRRLIHYIEDLENGLLQIPAFQRDFIWTNKNKLDLFDSLKNDYPIGSILFWQPQDNKRVEIENIGPYKVPAKQENFFYILDGFQRLSTILGCLIDPEKTKLECDKELWRKEYSIYYDLESEEFILPRPMKKIYQVPISDLINTRAAYLLEKALHESKDYDDKQIEKYIDRYTQLGSTLIDYSLPSIDIIGGEIEEVVEIFSRVNSKGSEISPDWMVSALTYNSAEEFRLGTEIDNLLEELIVFNFKETKRELILQCITNSFGKFHFDQASRIEKLVKEQGANFIKVSRRTILNIKKAVEFLFRELLVIDVKLLPYGSQLIFITDFFNQVENPTQEHLDKLKKWFWVTTYANYFTAYSLSKQREAYNQFQKFIKDSSQNPIYNDEPSMRFKALEFPNKIFFGSVRAKALVLFMLHYANKLTPFQADEIDGLNLNYLFFDKKDNKGNFYPESSIAIIDTHQRSLPKSKDMSFLLRNYRKEYEKYFLTEKMSALYALKEESYQDEILRERKDLLMKEEQIWVSNYDLDYGEGGSNGDNNTNTLT